MYYIIQYYVRHASYVPQAQLSPLPLPPGPSLRTLQWISNKIKHFTTKCTETLTKWCRLILLFSYYEYFSSYRKPEPEHVTHMIKFVLLRWEIKIRHISICIITIISTSKKNDNFDRFYFYFFCLLNQLSCVDD